MTSERQSNFFDVCSKCKTSYSCCFGTRPPITEERKRIIEEYLEKHGIPIVDAFVKEDYMFPKESVEGYCVFHDMKTRKCVVHAVKPETCVSGPVTFDINKKTGNIEWFVKMEKICPLAGVVYGDKELLQKHLESAKRELTHLARELAPDALKAILKKDEPETFKICENPFEKTVIAKLTR